MATIRKRGDRWQVQVRRKGFGAASKSFRVLKDAEAWARHMEVQADRCDLPPDPKTLDSIRFADLVRRYRDSVSPRKRGHESERYILTAFLAHPISCKPLSQLRTEDFALYRDQRLRTIKAVSLKRQLAIIHDLFEIARYEWGLPIRENPLDKLNLEFRPERRERRLRLGELEKLIAAARGEILAIEWEHIDFKDRILLIPRTKNGHSRTIPLTRTAIQILQSLPGTEGDHVFPITANAFRLAWERVKRQAGIEDLRFHDLRHEAISRFFEAGLNVPEVALISGHRDPRMLFRYTHPLQKQIAVKLEAFA